MIALLLTWCVISYIVMTLFIKSLIRSNSKHDELTIGPWQLFDHDTVSFFQYGLIVLFIVGAPILLLPSMLFIHMLPDPRK